jgi:hypothetical protein
MGRQHRAVFEHRAMSIEYLLFVPAEYHEHPEWYTAHRSPQRTSPTAITPVVAT